MVNILISTWKRTAIGVAFAAGALGSVVLPASAASAASSTQTQAFAGFAISPDDDGISPAIDRARADATASANRAGFFTCPTERLQVLPFPHPGRGWEVSVTVVCVR